jgi:hypothetical protein
VEQDERLRFSFGVAVAAYAEHRPDYARAAVRWALERAPGPRAGLWNVFDDRFDWVAGLERVSGSAAIGPRDTLSSWRAETADAHLPSTGLIAASRPETAHGEFTLPMLTGVLRVRRL